MEKTNWVIDYETLKNCTVLVAEDYKKDFTKTFVISPWRNDVADLINFLETSKNNKEWHISFNGLSFDSQITEYFLRNKKTLLTKDPSEIANLIHIEAKNIIRKQERNEFSQYSERDLQIKHIDVFKLNHWDNAAKRSSLKWIQYSMDWYNIQDMPIHHDAEVTENQLDMIIEYCQNDVKSTKQIMHLSKEQINLRKSLSNEYKINLYNASEPRISKELFLHFLEKETGISKYELKNLRTRRDVIDVESIILPYTNFKTPIFNDLLKNFKSLKVKDTKGGFKYSFVYKGVKTDFGLGGVHGCTDSGVYESKEGMIIMSSDVVSFYPNLGIRNKWAPAHLPQETFCQLYEWFFEERKKIPKKDPKNYVYKIILNSTYGLSNDENSFLYDPEFTMRIK